MSGLTAGYLLSVLCQISEPRWTVMSPPRLTGALRSFSNVSKKDDIDGQVYDLKVSKRCHKRSLKASGNVPILLDPIDKLQSYCSL